MTPITFTPDEIAHIERRREKARLQPDVDRRLPDKAEIDHMIDVIREDQGKANCLPTMAEVRRKNNVREAGKHYIHFYMRASTAPQEMSPAAQERELNAWAQRQDLDVMLPHAVDSAERRSKPFGERPAGRKLLQEMQSGDTLVIVRIDRLGDDPIDIAKVVVSLNKRDIRLVVLDFENVELDMTQPIGQLFVLLFAWMAKYETHVKSARIRAVVAIRKERGLPLNGMPRLGFKRARLPDANGKLRLVYLDCPEDIVVCREVYERRSRGEKFCSIYADLWRRRLKTCEGTFWAKPRKTRKPTQNWPHGWAADPARNGFDLYEKLLAEGRV